VLAKARPDVVVIPCVGSFSLASVAVDAGLAPPQVFCGDISLYSTALGNAIMGKDWRLEVTDGHQNAGDLVRPWVEKGGPLEKAAAVCLMLRVLQYDRKDPKEWHKDRQRELTTNAGAYMQQLMEQLAAIQTKLAGLHYAAQDMWITLEEHRHNPMAVILANPPRYTGGYDRQFRGIDEVFSWDSPQVAQFVEGDYARLMELLGASPARTLMYYATQQEDPTPLWGEPWRAVFADRPGNTKHSGINWIIANCDDVQRMMCRTKLSQGEAQFKLFDGEVRPDSVLGAVRLSADTANYYRDLFIHRIEGGLAETYVGLLLDGCLFAVVGLHLKAWRAGAGAKKGTLSSQLPGRLIFAFSVEHPLYERLHKLTLMSVLSSWMWDDCLKDEVLYQLRGAPPTVASVMLTPHPENKTARGTGFKMTARAREGAEYKLSYSGDVVKRTREETLQLWLTKFSQTRKAKAI
jgi:hypothetical protein